MRPPQSDTPLRPTAPRRRRAWGQHFLTDQTVVDRILLLADLGPGDTVVEIGPGRGALTIPLAARIGQVGQGSGRLVAIERDPVLTEALAPRLSGQPHVTLQCADALTYPYDTIAPSFTVVANLPYAIATPLLFRLLEFRDRIPLMVLMLQREVARRIVAGPGSKTYGHLSVAVQYRAEVRLAFTVPPGAFRPPPQVESAVVVIHPQSPPRVLVPNEARFFALLRAAFGQRRKTVFNALRHGRPPEEAARLRAAFAAVKIDPSSRAERLDLEAFARLDDALAHPVATRGDARPATSRAPQRRGAG